MQPTRHIVKYMQKKFQDQGASEMLVCNFFFSITTREMEALWGEYDYISSWVIIMGEVMRGKG